MLWRIEYFNEENTGVIKENFTIAQSTLTKIASVKSDHITLLLEWHDPKILQGIHVRYNFRDIYQIACHGDWAGVKLFQRMF
jgi:hypothetical protein